MAMVGVVSGSLYRRTHSLSRLVWCWVGGRFGAILRSPNELGELSQWLSHDDRTINIVLVIIIIIIIITGMIRVTLSIRRSAVKLSGSFTLSVEWSPRV